MQNSFQSRYCNCYLRGRGDFKLAEYWLPDGEVLALGWCSTGSRMVQYWLPDGAVLAPGWCSTGHRMVKYWPSDGSIHVRRCCRKRWEHFWGKIKQTAGCVDKPVACHKF